jgi:CspA family cold shock protein
MSYTGTVKWFKGSYGFIITDGEIPEVGKGELFVYYSGIKAEGFRKLRRGQKVKFEIVKGANGYQAVDVEVTGDSSPNVESKS